MYVDSRQPLGTSLVLEGVDGQRDEIRSYLEVSSPLIFPSASFIFSELHTYYMVFCRAWFQIFLSLISEHRVNFAQGIDHHYSYVLSFAMACYL